MGIGKSFKKAAHKLGKVAKKAVNGVADVTKDAAPYLFAPVTGGASLLLTGSGKSTPSVNTDESDALISRYEENAKKARAKLLATSGGILGSQVEDVEKSSRTLFGN